MAKKFNNLSEQMSQESRDRAQAKAEKMLANMRQQNQNNPSFFLNHHCQTGMFIIAPSGTGKFYHAILLALDNLADHKTVLIMDCSKSYKKLVHSRLCDTFDSHYICLKKGGLFEIKHPITSKGILTRLSNRFKRKSLGGARLIVYDFDELGSEQWIGDLPCIPDVIDSNSFILIDESVYVAKRCANIVTDMHQWVKQGASFCITGQVDDDVLAFKSLPLPTTTMRLSRALAPQ